MQEIFDKVKNYNFLIIGNPSSGKTFLSKVFTKTHQVIHTDDFIKYGHEESLIKIIKSISGKSVIEGMAGYRLLRHGLKNKSYLPDVVIEVENKNVRYPKEKKDKMEAFIKGTQTILKDYKSMPNDNPPIWVKINNKHAGNI